MARICPLFSGSTGNSTYILSDKGGILIDAGASFKSLNEAVENAGGTLDTLRAVAVTHEHTDHIKGLKNLLKKTGVPVIASQKTLETLINADLIPQETQTLCAEDTNEIYGIGINRFATSHDCLGSSGYVITLSDGKKIAVCTDLGVVTDEVRNSLYGCNAVLIESNHDIEMLKKGPYPPQLKLRIMSDTGHLSNNACATELKELLKNGTTRFILGHISRNNNLPMLALSCSRATLADIGAKDGNDYILTAAKPCFNEVVLL